MPRGHPAVSKEVKLQIIKRIRDDAVPVAQVASEYGISTKTIYRWLGTGVTTPPSVLEVDRLKREKPGLKGTARRTDHGAVSREKKGGCS